VSDRPPASASGNTRLDGPEVEGATAVDRALRGALLWREPHAAQHGLRPGEPFSNRGLSKGIGILCVAGRAPLAPAPCCTASPATTHALSRTGCPVGLELSALCEWEALDSQLVLISHRVDSGAASQRLATSARIILPLCPCHGRMQQPALVSAWTRSASSASVLCSFCKTSCSTLALHQALAGAAPAGWRAAAPRACQTRRPWCAGRARERRCWTRRAAPGAGCLWWARPGSRSAAHIITLHFSIVLLQSQFLG